MLIIKQYTNIKNLYDEIQLLNFVRILRKVILYKNEYFFEHQKNLLLHKYY